MSKKVKVDELTIDGTVYVPKDSVRPRGPRCIVVLDRGWIFAGDVERKDGRLLIHNAIQVQSWSGGFDQMVQNPKSGKVKLIQTLRTVDSPCDAELFCVPVEDDWGE